MQTNRIKDIALGAGLGLVLATTLALAGGRNPWHPLLVRAEKQLGNAKATLSSATHDCGGHRVKAIELISQAMQEVQQGRQYADAHPEEARK